MKNPPTKLILFFIILLFLLTRFYKITEIPMSVYWDEASIGYNAYSIIQTGKDEWGEFLPLHFRAFGEFKLPVYIYATAISVKLFGLNEFAIRLPAVIFSLGVVFLTYLLTKKLFNNEKAALFSSFFMTISPWFFIFSRTGYEVTAGLMFYLLAIYLFFFSAKNPWFLFFSLVSFILSAYSYNSFRIISPLTFLFFIIIERKNLSFFILMISLFILALSIWPIYKLYVYDAGAARFQVVGDGSADFFKNYLSHFSFDFLMFGDKNLRSQQAGFGQIFPYDFLLLPLGIFYILKFKSKYGLLTLALALISIIPAALTKESPHGLRALSVVPFISIISSVGIGKYLKVPVIIVALIFFGNYFYNFLSIYPTESATAWQYEYKKIFVEYKDYDNYEQILVSDQYAQPYIFALFYLKYDPAKFQKEAVRNNPQDWGFSSVKSFGNFKFTKDE